MTGHGSLAPLAVPLLFPQHRRVLTTPPPYACRSTGGYVWTSSMQDCSILRFHPSGYFIARFDLQPWVSGYGCLTSGLAVDNNNHLWVTSRTDPGFVFRINANQDSSPVMAVVSTSPDRPLTLFWEVWLLNVLAHA